MTLEEIRNITFSKGRGYRADEVDEFIDGCVETVEHLTKENVELVRKIKILANKVLEYRDQTNSVQSAISKAQEAGDTFIDDAQERAKQIIQEANEQAEAVRSANQRLIEEEERKLRHLQEQVELFKACVVSLYQEQLDLFTKLPTVETKAVEVPVEQPEEVEVKPEEVEVKPEEVEVKPEEVDMPLPVDMNATTKLDESSSDEESVRFSDLKFGSDYDISEDQSDEGEKNPFRKKRR